MRSRRRGRARPAGGRRGPLPGRGGALRARRLREGHWRQSADRPAAGGPRHRPLPRGRLRHRHERPPEHVRVRALVGGGGRRRVPRGLPGHARARALRARDELPLPTSRPLSLSQLSAGSPTRARSTSRSTPKTTPGWWRRSSPAWTARTGSTTMRPSWRCTARWPREGRRDRARRGRGSTRPPTPSTRMWSWPRCATRTRRACARGRRGLSRRHARRRTPASSSTTPSSTSSRSPPTTPTTTGR